jgi:hypothetical protein
VSPADDVSGVILSLCLLGVVCGIAALISVAVYAPKCPLCNELLHEVKVVPLDGSMPPRAKWYCHVCEPTRWFAELPADIGPSAAGRLNTTEDDG